MDAVVVVFDSVYELSINWIGNAMNDTIADAVLAIILAAESSPASLKGMPLRDCVNISCGHDITTRSGPTGRPTNSHSALP